MTPAPTFPTPLHRDTAELARDYFSTIPGVDTVLVVNSCARGRAVPESDLDFAILMQAGLTAADGEKMEQAWKTYAETHPTFLKYRQSSPFAHLHLDVIHGNYTPFFAGKGEPIDYFEVEIGNQICYAAPMGPVGPHFTALQEKWLPYYDEELRLQRFNMAKDACAYDLDHIPLFVQRRLHFQAFDILCKAFQEFLQTLFICHKVYPLAYNKWIKEQVAEWLNKPALYARLPPILSVTNIETEEINAKAAMLRELLTGLNN